MAIYRNFVLNPVNLTKPGEGSFHDPSFWDDLKADRRVGSLDDCGFQAGQYFLLCLFENWPLVSAVGKEFLQKRKPAEQGSKDKDGAIPILDIGGVNHGVKQEPYRINKDVALLPLDFLARVVARWIDAGPPFSAPFTLWLSMTHAVGLASRPIASRHLT